MTQVDPAEYRDCPIPYDHYEDGVSVQWAFDNGGIVRFHTPGTGPYDCDFYATCCVRILDPQRCEIMAMCSPVPISRKQHEIVKGYLKLCGYSIFSRRLKNGKVIVKEYK